MRSFALPNIASQAATARIALLFDNSTSADRLQFLDDDESLRPSVDVLQKMEFPLKFPDVFSIKVILLGTVSCNSSACSFDLEQLKSMQQKLQPQVAAGTQKP